MHLEFRINILDVLANGSCREKKIFGYGIDATSPEAKLAREAELPYALIGMVTDYDCWRENEAAVDVGSVIAQLHANAGAARALIGHLAASLPAVRPPNAIDTVLDYAIITDPSARDPAAMQMLKNIVRRL